MTDRFYKEIEARRAKYNIPCKGYYSPATTDGPSEFTCEYENAPFCCEYCIYQGGHTNPITGRRVYKRKERPLC